jgi:hypothetical protein
MPDTISHLIPFPDISLACSTSNDIEQAALLLIYFEAKQEELEIGK